MGTTLTGTTPQDTYDSLIKVTDNGPISGTLKALSDGLGNDSTLSLSTTAASIAGTLAVTGNATFDTNTLFVDAANDRVGVGLTAPQSKVHIQGAIAGAAPAALLRIGNNGIGNIARIILTDENTQDGNIAFQGSADSTVQYLGFGVGSALDSLKITGNNFVRLSSSMGGIQFNGDTAAANALDDYEEGTWTIGVSFGGASVGVTYLNNSGTYTKVGRKVTVIGLMELSNKGSSTGSAFITGLPFTVASGVSFFSSPSLGNIRNITFLNVMNAYTNQGATTITLGETTNLGAFSALNDVDFANNSEVAISLTYFV
jgi:hypothetical protein